MKTTLEILKAARALLVDKGWTTGASARNALGEPVAPYADDAACFCASGAIIRVSSTFYDECRASGELNGFLRESLMHFNDLQASVEPVLRLFDRAIAKLEAGGS